MFQYAMGARLAHNAGAGLWLDLTKFTRPDASTTRREYELGDLSTHAKLLDSSPGSPFRPASVRARWIMAGCAIEEEKSLAFDRRVATADRPVYLAGYWQSYKYFDVIATQIRADFQLRSPLTLTPLEVPPGARTVSVHFRRSDYVTNHAAREHHGTLDLDYYRRAVDIVLAAEPDVHAVVFSDDPDWCRANVHLDVPMSFCTPAGGSAQELHRMSTCDHHILANSSFSWWAAWLRPAPDKVVVGPVRWIADDSHPVEDLFPSGWVAI